MTRHDSSVEPSLTKTDIEFVFILFGDFRKLAMEFLQARCFVVYRNYDGKHDDTSLARKARFCSVRFGAANRYCESHVGGNGMAMNNN